MNIRGSDFGQGFRWGAASAAYQVEGAWNVHGKGKSVWDVFSSNMEKTYAGQNGDIACDFYHRFVYDLSILHELKIPDFRFSISWSRVIPNGIGTMNPAGIDFYNRVIDLCLELGIEPWVTLYHWDLPFELEKKGGWANRDVIGWFGSYVGLCIKHFGDRVKHWMILNEPMVFTGAGYFMGVHAPGRKGLNSFLAAAHHAAMCQAEGGRIVRSLLADARIGTTFSCSCIQPYNHAFQHVRAAQRVDTLLNRMFVEPLAGMGYPVNDLKLLQRLEPFIKDGDESKLSFRMDFVGVQNYTREVVAFSPFTPLIWAKVIKAGQRNVETTEMGWEVYPESLYEMLLKFSRYDMFNEIVVTENGAAFPDEVINGQVKDIKRIDYLEQYIRQVLKAKREGVNVTGYFVWSFTDNFEWAEGYKPRFGLVHVDFETQKRVVKDSGYWYSRLVQGN